MEIGKALEGELAAKALQRMKSGIANPEENFPQGRAPQTRDIAAKAAGFGNGKTYEQAKAQSEVAPLPGAARPAPKPRAGGYMVAT